MINFNTFIEQFSKTKKNANCVLDLEKSLLSDDENEIIASIDVVKEFFIYLFEKSLLHSSPTLSIAEEKFRLWLLQRYKDFNFHLNDYLIHGCETIQEKSLLALMKAIELEGKRPFKKLEENSDFCPKHHFQKILCGLLSTEVDQQVLIMKYQNFSDYDDVKMYLLKGVLRRFQEVEEVTDIFLSNCFYLMNLLKYPSNFLTKENSPEGNTNNFLLPKEFFLQKKQFCKWFSSVWCQFLKYKLPNFLLKKTLLILHKQVLSHLQNPCLLTDFLTDAYMKGDIVSLLALNSLYFLMDRYNIEYPDFFTKLYSLTDKEIVNGKYSAKFFFLCYKFLSSTHIPVSVIASFAKRLSRISLNSKTETILMIIPFVLNLVIQHPSLSVLIHRTEPEGLDEDPFDFTASNPVESRALESSFWEIKTLQSHVNPEIARKAKLINKELPVMEYDLSLVVDISISDLYRNERKRKFVEVPANVQKVQKLDRWWLL